MEHLGHLRRVPRVLMTAHSHERGVLDFPVRLAVASEDLGWFAVFADSPAVEALDAQPNVRFAFCNFRARPGGSDQPGQAERIEGGQEHQARAVLERKWPFWFRAYLAVEHSARHRSLVYYRLAPTEEPTPWAVGL